MSITDLSRKAQDKVPPEEWESVKIPSNMWIRLQFIPFLFSWCHSPFVKQFDIQFHVQKRILRANHEDAHYAAAQFWYLREFSVCQKHHCTSLRRDDKHSIAIGEPNAAVASLDRGCWILASVGMPVLALDHDFMKAKLTPSVVLAINIPDSITESFYWGRVFIDVRDEISHLHLLSRIHRKRLIFLTKHIKSIPIWHCSLMVDQITTLHFCLYSLHW